MYTRIACGVLAVIAFIILFIVIRKTGKKEEIEPEGLDTMIEDEIIPKKPEQYAPIEFEGKSKKAHIENEVKKYATQKPEQVADIIKSWLTDDER